VKLRYVGYFSWVPPVSCACGFRSFRFPPPYHDGMASSFLFDPIWVASSRGGARAYFMPDRHLFLFQLAFLPLFLSPPREITSSGLGLQPMRFCSSSCKCPAGASAPDLLPFCTLAFAFSDVVPAKFRRRRPIWVPAPFFRRRKRRLTGLSINYPLALDKGVRFEQFLEDVSAGGSLQLDGSPGIKGRGRSL